MTETSRYTMTCPSCGRQLKFTAAAIGKKARCPACQSHVLVSAQGSASLITMPSLILDGRNTEHEVTPPPLPQTPYAPLSSSPPPLMPSVPVEPPSTNTVADGALTDRGPRRSATKTLMFGGAGGGLLLLLALGAGIVFVINQSVNGPLQDVITKDERNRGIEARAYYGDIGLSILVFDLTNVSATNSRADVFRVFLHYADAVKDQEFGSVQLAWRGKVRFKIAGDYFRTLGREFESQNPVYTIRTFPEHLRRPDGERAFAVWGGGMLGVLNAQMADFSKFHDEWYLDDLRRE